MIRTLGIPSAVLIGLASMIGTGVFAAWSPAYSLAGSALLFSLIIAASIATLNAISNARMAGIFPQSGGGYVYGKNCLGSPAALIAGFSFVIGKTASASAAALVIGVYLAPDHSRIVAVFAVLIVLVLNLRGLKLSVVAMAVSVSIVVAVIVTLIVLSQLNESPREVTVLTPEPTTVSIFAAAGILFVAFAGYARISVIASEVKRPAFVIPWAIGISLTLVLVLYFFVAVVLLQFPQTLGSPSPLDELATIFEYPEWLIQVAVVLAAGSALFALNIGIGRMIFATAADGPLPSSLAVVSGPRAVPMRAEILTGVVVLVLVIFGGIGLNLAVSGFFVLCYYTVVQFSSMTRKGNLMIRWVIPILGLCVMTLVIGSLVLSVQA